MTKRAKIVLYWFVAAVAMTVVEVYASYPAWNQPPAVIILGGIWVVVAIVIAWDLRKP